MGKLRSRMPCFIKEKKTFCRCKIFQTPIRLGAVRGARDAKAPGQRSGQKGA